MTARASSQIVQVSRTPASQNHPRAPTTGVREAPRHEIAGRKGLGFGAAIYGDLRRASVCFREAGTTDALHFDGLIGRGERAPPALEKLDLGIFHVVEKYELLQKQARIELEAELFLRDIDDVGERDVLIR